MSRVKGSPKTGGKKKGSKHKKTIEQEKALEFLRKKVREQWEELIDTKLELAKGMWVERVDKEGTIKIYRKPPDSQTLEYLFSIVVGKPTQPIDVSATEDLKKLEKLYREMFNPPKEEKVDKKKK